MPRKYNSFELARFQRHNMVFKLDSNDCDQKDKCKVDKLYKERITVTDFGKTYRAKRMLSLKFLKSGLSVIDYRKKKEPFDEMNIRASSTENRFGTA